MEWLASTGHLECLRTSFFGFLVDSSQCEKDGEGVWWNLIVCESLILLCIIGWDSFLDEKTYDYFRSRLQDARDPFLSHKEIARTCITYLCLDKCDDDALHKYATYFWGKHAAEQGLDKESTDFLLRNAEHVTRKTDHWPFYASRAHREGYSLIHQICWFGIPSLLPGFEDFTHEDLYGRNFLHYAAMNGKNMKEVLEFIKSRVTLNKVR